MINVLVTGSYGQLGTCLKDIIKNKKTNNRYFFSDINKDADYTLDITSKDDVNKFITEHDINVVVNCAAYTNVDGAEEDKDRAELINCTSLNNFIIPLSKNKGSIIHISTDYVFGDDETNDTKMREPNGNVSPMNVYGATKLKGEELLKKSDIDYIIIRTSWLYSQYGKNFVKTMIKLFKKSEEDGTSVKVINNQYGCPTNANDLAELIIHIIEDGFIKSENKGIYHFCNYGITTWFDFASEIKRAIKSKAEVIPISDDEFKSKAKRPKFSPLATDNTERVFKINHIYWRESLNNLLKTYKKWKY